MKKTKISFLLGVENIENIHFIKIYDAAKLCFLLNIDLDIYYDKYSNMEMTYKICEKYDYDYDYIEKIHGLCIYYNKNNSKKRIIMKSDIKGYLHSPTFFHELGHALEGYLFHNSQEETLVFTQLKKDFFSMFLKEKNTGIESIESTEYIADILGFLLVAKIDYLSKNTNYLYSYYHYFKSINIQNESLSDLMFLSFFMNDKSVNMIRKAMPFVSSADCEYIEFLSATLEGLFKELNLDFSYYKDFFNQRIVKFKETKTTFVEDAIINFLKLSFEF